LLLPARLNCAVGLEAALPPGNAARRGLPGKEVGAANPIIQIFIPQFD
jgi:hypothetical protein